jgi:hypothetical protein
MKKNEESNLNKFINEIEDSYTKKYTKTEFTIYIVLRILVIAVMIRQIFTANWNNVFLCVLTLFLFLLPTIIQRSLNVTLPNTLEIIILLFIFSAEILGEINNFYGLFKHWDTILHTINGFLCAAIGFSLIDLLNRTERFHITLSPIFVALVAFCFSMTIGVLWEFFEFGVDKILKMDMQKDEIVSSISSVSLDPDNHNKPIVINNIKSTAIYSVDNQGNTLVTTIPNGYLDLGLNDTMIDLLVNFIGASLFSILGLLYIKDRDEYKFVEHFLPILRKKKHTENDN